MFGSSETHNGGSPAAKPPPTARRSGAPRWLRCAALAMTVVFAWTLTLAVPAQALAHSAAPAACPGIRVLSGAEMARLVGSSGHPTPVSSAPGSTYAWEGNIGDANTGNGNKLTQLPVVAWTQRGGLPVSFVLAHNSQSDLCGAERRQCRVHAGFE